MNKKTQHTNVTHIISRQKPAPTGKDLPLLDHQLKTQGPASQIRFTHPRTQCNSLDLSLETDRSNKQVIKVIDSAGKDTLREIPHSDLQFIMQLDLVVQYEQDNGCKCITGTEVATSLYSALEVL